MTPPQPWFWPQSQTSYGRMYTMMGSIDFATKLKITVFRPKTRMALPQPYIWPQSQTSYGRMYTRIGSFDFGTKLKFSPEKFMQ